jgi:hypothetical protein
MYIKNYNPHDVKSRFCDNQVITPESPNIYIFKLYLVTNTIINNRQPQFQVGG